METSYGLEHPADMQKLEKDSDDFRRLLCLMGVKLQQLSRMTGISYETINKAKNDCWNLRKDKDEHLIYNG